MARYVALDVSQAETHLCVVDEKNKMIWQGKCLTSPTAIAGRATGMPCTPICQKPLRVVLKKAHSLSRSKPLERP